MKKEKKEKKVKIIKAKKLPGIFKKKYTLKKIESRLLKNIDIPSDREMVKNLFQPLPDKEGLYAADLKAEIEKAKFKKLKKIAKDIKSRKFGFKILPFAALVIFITGLSLGVFLFKDFAVKKALVSVMQSAFGAKTDIDYAHLEIFSSRLEIKGIQQASSDDEMKNIFQVSDLVLDFNLTEALRGKVDIEDVKIGQVLFNTDRKKSGKLAKLQKEKKVKEKKEKSKKSSSNKKQNDLMKKTQNTLNSMFSDYNPENIYKNLEASLKSPQLALKAQELTQGFVEKWQKEPEEIQSYVEQVQTLVSRVNGIDWQKLNDPVKIKEVIDLVNNSIKTGNQISEKTQSVMKDVEADSNTVKGYAKEVSEAFAADKKIIDSEIAKFTVLKDRGIKNLFNDMITAFVYGMAEEYSPYGRQIVDKGLELKAKHDSSAAKKKSDKKKAKKLKMKKRIARRDQGRFVYYKKDRVPKFLLENAYGSGQGWEFSAKEFSSDPDKRNSQSLLNMSLALAGIENKLNAVIEARSNSENPLVNALYSGKNIPSDIVIESYGMKSKSDLDFDLVVKNDDKLSGKGVMNLSSIQIITPSFEPALIYDIYKDTIDSIKNMKVDFGYSWNEDDGLSLDLQTDAAEVFQAAFTASFNKAMKKIMEGARENIIQMLSEKTGLAGDKISEFMDIEKLLKSYDQQIKQMKGQLENRKKEAENLLKGSADRLKKQAEAEAKKLQQEAEARARSEAEKAKKEAEAAAKKEAEKQAKNLLKGFGF